MEHPLFVCVVSKTESQIAIYSCMQLWTAVFTSRVPPRAITIAYDGQPGVEDPSPGQLKYVVDLGPPILEQRVEEIEGDPKIAHSVLREWIALDESNIARKRIGRISLTTLSSWTTNSAPSTGGAIVHNGYFFGPDYGLAEKHLAPILTALAHNYRHAKDVEKLSALCALMRHFSQHLDRHGLDFADGNLPSIDRR
jgi:hypothetical protein